MLGDDLKDLGHVLVDDSEVEDLSAQALSVKVEGMCMSDITEPYFKLPPQAIT